MIFDGALQNKSIAALLICGAGFPACSLLSAGFVATEEATKGRRMPCQKLI
jgi:hypothetical protein